MNAVQFLNKEGMTYLLKVTKISKKGWSQKRKKVKSKVEGKIISLTSTELIFQKVEIKQRFYQIFSYFDHTKSLIFNYFYFPINKKIEELKK